MKKSAIRRSPLAKTPPVPLSSRSRSKNPSMSIAPAMPIEFPDLESALARASARLRAPNQKLLELARSQPEVIGKAKDISPGISELTCQALCGTNVICLRSRIRARSQTDRTARREFVLSLSRPCSRASMEATASGGGYYPRICPFEDFFCRPAEKSSSRRLVASLRFTESIQVQRSSQSR